MRVRQEAFGKKEKTKKTRIVMTGGVLAMIAMLVLVPVFRSVSARAEFKSELEALQNANVGDSVYFGRFDTDPSHIGRERLSWIVIRKEGEKLCLLSFLGIAPGAYHNRHEAVSWEDCDLRRRLNSEEFISMFSSYEKEMILSPEEGEDRLWRDSEPDNSDGLYGGIDEERDYLTFLREEELEELFPAKEERILEASESAIRQGVNCDRLSHHDVWLEKFHCYSWWWLRPEDDCTAVTAPVVEMDGTLVRNQRAVNKPHGAIRPVV